MKVTAVAKAISAAAVRLGVSASVQSNRMVAAVFVSPIKLAYALGNFLLTVSKEESVEVLSQRINHFFKRLTDQAAVADSISSQLYKSFREDAGLSDSEILALFKNLNHQAKIDDVRQFVFVKALSNRSAAVDRLVRNLSTTKADAASVNDVIRLSLVFSRAFVEAATVQELHANHLNKRISNDTGFVSDSIELLRSKHFNDLGRAVDALARNLSKGLSDQAGVLDTIRFAGIFNRSLAESFVAAENLVLSARLSKNESAQVTDTGSLNKQNYTSGAYFAENYVGTSSSF